MGKKNWFLHEEYRGDKVGQSEHLRNALLKSTRKKPQGGESVLGGPWSESGGDWGDLLGVKGGAFKRWGGEDSSKIAESNARPRKRHILA